MSGLFSAPGVQLGLVTLQLLGARVSSVMHKDITHILFVPNETATNDFSIDALQAIVPSFGLKLATGDDEVHQPAASAASAASTFNNGFRRGQCRILSLSDIETHRMRATEEINRQPR